MGSTAPSDAVARLAVVQRVTEVGLLPLGPDETLREVLDRVRAGLGAATATIMLLDEPGESVVVRASVGLESEVSNAVRVPVGAGITGRVAATGRPLLVPDIAAASPVSPLLAGSGMRSMAVVPLAVAGTLIGVIHVASDRLAAFDEDDVALLTLLADRVALAVERVRVAEREQAVLADLRASERRLRAVLDTATDGVLLVDATGQVESANPAAERLFGYCAGELLGQDVSRLLVPSPLHAADPPRPNDLDRRAPRAAGRPGGEVQGRRRDGSHLPLELTISDTGDPTGLFTYLVRDITERRAFEAQLAHQAVHDPLTGLGNRMMLTEQLDRALARQVRRPRPLGLLFVDLDGFKLVNDTLGHDAGDELLIEAAARLRQAVRPEDIVVRLGGDEFVVLCEELAEPASADDIAGRLVREMSRPFTVRGREVVVSGSVGVVTHAGERSRRELLQDADAAMYQAKAQGRGRYSRYDESTRAEMVERVQLTAQARQMVDRGQLRAVYQLLVDLTSGEVVAAEALVRWEHPQRGLLDPAAFFPLVEDSGTIVEIDRWMLRRACSDAAVWTRVLGRPLGVWVNVSGRTLADRALPAAVESVLREAGLAASQLTLEVTEAALIRDVSTTTAILRNLHELGVRLAVDDFGSGYSSLAQLQHLPVHALKVDRSFVGGLDGRRRDPDQAQQTEVVRALVGLADALHLRTVAEGIETPEQLAVVGALGCDLAQGFFLGRPATAEELLTAAQHGITWPPAA